MRDEFNLGQWLRKTGPIHPDRSGTKIRKKNQGLRLCEDLDSSFRCHLYVRRVALAAGMAALANYFGLIRGAFAMGAAVI
jgi:hypothetical protein